MVTSTQMACVYSYKAAASAVRSDYYAGNSTRVVLRGCAALVLGREPLRPLRGVGVSGCREAIEGVCAWRAMHVPTSSGTAFLGAGPLAWVPSASLRCEQLNFIGTDEPNPRLGSGVESLGEAIELHAPCPGSSGGDRNLRPHHGPNGTHLRTRDISCRRSLDQTYSIAASKQHWR